MIVVLQNHDHKKINVPNTAKTVNLTCWRAMAQPDISKCHRSKKALSGPD